MHFKSNPLFSESVSVDRDKGVVFGVQILKSGKNKNGTYFGDKYLANLAIGANEQKQGVKSRFGHPNMCSTSLGTFLGRYKNFRKESDKVFADLHLDDISKKTQVDGKGISMFEYVMDMAEKNPDMFGNSIHIPEPQYEDEQVEIGGLSYSSHIYNGIIASDVVDDPAATDGLFDFNGDIGVTVTRFLNDNPTIFDVVQKNPNVIEDFFGRYATYLTQFKKSIDMTFLDKLKKKFGSNETFNIEETTATGEIVTVKTEDETPKVGDEIVNADGAAFPDGDITVKDGTVWVIEGGRISEIKESETESSEDENQPTMGEVMQSVNLLAKAFDKFRSQYNSDLKENQDAIELVSNTFDKKFSNLAKTVKSNAPSYQAEEKKRQSTLHNNSGYDPDIAREARELRKSKNKK